MRLFLGITLIAHVVLAQDTVRVRAGAPLWGPNVGVKQLYVLGGPPDYDIGAVHSTAIDKVGRVYVFDIQRLELRAYDASGKFVRFVGRKGAGPGEFRVVLGATVVRDTVLAIYDPGALRISYFLPDGTYDGMTQLKRPLTLNTGMLRSDFTDNFLMRATFIMTETGSAPLAASRQQVIRVAPDGHLVDSLPLPQFPLIAETSINPLVRRGSYFESPAGAIVFGKGDEYRFTIRPFAGAPRVVEKDWKPVPVGDEERAQLIARAEEGSARERTHPSFSIPKVKPAYVELFADQDGRIWVDLYAPAERRNIPRDTSKSALPPLDWRQSPTFDVFDPAGRYLGHVTLPYGSSLWAARGNRVYAKSTGPEGESRLIAYELTGMKR
jgi:hypothetical protein